MHRKKEIIVIVFIVLVTITLVLIPLFINMGGSEVEDDKNKKSDIFITIRIEGEINNLKDKKDLKSITNVIELDFISGVTFGEISKIIENNYTRYSIRPTNYTTRYFKNTTIVIESSYIYTDEDVDDDGKVNINTGTKAELITLYGIGEKRAEKIINYRKDNLIKTYEELKEIIGVSDEVIEIIKNSSVL